MALGALALVIVRMAMTLGAVRDAEQDNFDVARIDELTGLRNRRAFLEEGEQRFSDRGEDQRIGVIVIDLDGFKEINDSLGHASGDELLRDRRRKRFASIADGRGQIARIGGDEFAGPSRSTRSPRSSRSPSRTAAMFTDPITLDGVTVRVGGSHRRRLLPGARLTPTDLLRCADVAMYEAKGEHSRSASTARRTTSTPGTASRSSTTCARRPGSATSSALPADA